MEMCHQQNWSHGKQYQGCREEKLAHSRKVNYKLKRSINGACGELWDTMKGSSVLIIDIEEEKGYLSFKAGF